MPEAAKPTLSAKSFVAIDAFDKPLGLHGAPADPAGFVNAPHTKNDKKMKQQAVKSDGNQADGSGGAGEQAGGCGGDGGPGMLPCSADQGHAHPAAPANLDAQQGRKGISTQSGTVLKSASSQLFSHIIQIRAALHFGHVPKCLAESQNECMVSKR